MRLDQQSMHALERTKLRLEVSALESQRDELAMALKTLADKIENAGWHPSEIDAARAALAKVKP